MNNEELEQRITNVLHPYLFELNDEETRDKITVDLTEAFKDVGFTWKVVASDDKSFTFGASSNGEAKFQFEYSW